VPFPQSSALAGSFLLFLFCFDVLFFVLLTLPPGVRVLSLSLFIFISLRIMLTPLSFFSPFPLYFQALYRPALHAQNALGASDFDGWQVCVCC
jgi:hypothetical protein